MKYLSKIKWQYLVVLFAGIVVGSYLTITWLNKPAQAKVVTLSSRGVSFEVVSNSNDVLGLLAEQNLDVREAYIDPSPETTLINGMSIRYQGSLNIRLTDQGNSNEVLSSFETVEEILKENGISLSPLDEVSPAGNTLIYSGLEIIIERVEEGEIVEEYGIPYEHLVRGNPEKLYGTEQLVQAGKPGVEEITYSVRYRDGQEEFRVRLSSQVTIAPVDEIIEVGRKIIVESYEQGRASWYSYQSCLCAAHPFFPKGSYLRVTAVASGKSVIVAVNDSGPNQTIHPERVLDLDAEAFKLLAPLGAGTIEVRVEKIKSG